jgi:hypothetical protein
VFALTNFNKSLKIFFSIVLLYCPIMSIVVSIRDEHKYSNIQIFKYFGPRIYIRIRIYYLLDIRIYSNIRSKLRIYSNIFSVFSVFKMGKKGHMTTKTST